MASKNLVIFTCDDCGKDITGDRMQSVQENRFFVNGLARVRRQRLDYHLGCAPKGVEIPKPIPTNIARPKPLPKKAPTKRARGGGIK